MEDFSQWILGSKPRCEFFGVDRPPKGDYFYHVHIRPLNNPPELSKWDAAYKAGLRQTSDAMLMYVPSDCGEKYLLFAQFDDPTAHKLWNRSIASSNRTRNRYTEIAKKFHENWSSCTFNIPMSYVQTNSIVLKAKIDEALQKQQAA